MNHALLPGYPDADVVGDVLEVCTNGLGDVRAHFFRAEGWG